MKPTLPARLLVDLVLLVIGGYLISFAQTWGLYDFQSMLAVFVSWYAVCCLDAMLVVLRSPIDGWPRYLGGGLTALMLIAFAFTFLRSVTVPVWVQVLMALAPIPGAFYAATGRYPLLRDTDPPPPQR